MFSISPLLAVDEDVTDIYKLSADNVVIQIDLFVISHLSYLRTKPYIFISDVLFAAGQYPTRECSAPRSNIATQYPMNVIGLASVLMCAVTLCIGY